MVRPGRERGLIPALTKKHSGAGIRLHVLGNRGEHLPFPGFDLQAETTAQEGAQQRVHMAVNQTRQQGAALEIHPLGGRPHPGPGATAEAAISAPAWSTLRRLVVPARANTAWLKQLTSCWLSSHPMHIGATPCDYRVQLDPGAGGGCLRL